MPSAKKSITTHYAQDAYAACNWMGWGYKGKTAWLVGMHAVLGTSTHAARRRSSRTVLSYESLSHWLVRKKCRELEKKGPFSGAFGLSFAG